MRLGGYIALFRVRSASAALLAVTLIMACDDAGDRLTFSGARPGAPLGVERADAETCSARLRADLEGAIAVRERLADLGADISTDRAVVGGVASDPSSDTTALGIPLTDAELENLESHADLLGTLNGLGLRLDLAQGGGDAYGGMWFDGPQQDRVVVALRDATVLPIATCLVPPGRQARFVTAAWSVADLKRLHARVIDDAESGVLRQAGIDVVLIGEGIRQDVSVIVVGVTSPVDAAARIMHGRYGDAVLVERGEAVDVNDESFWSPMYPRSAGEVAERLKAALLKSADSQEFVGSNPTLSATR